MSHCVVACIKYIIMLYSFIIPCRYCFIELLILFKLIIPHPNLSKFSMIGSAEVTSMSPKATSDVTLTPLGRPVSTRVGPVETTPAGALPAPKAASTPYTPEQDTLKVTCVGPPSPPGTSINKIHNKIALINATLVS